MVSGSPGWSWLLDAFYLNLSSARIAGTHGYTLLSFSFILVLRIWIQNLPGSSNKAEALFKLLHFLLESSYKQNR